MGLKFDGAWKNKMDEDKLEIARLEKAKLDHQSVID